VTAAPVLKFDYSATAGAPSTVFTFDGTAAITHVFAGTGTDLFPTGAFSFACWLKTSGTTGPLFSYTATGGSSPLLTVSNPGQLTIGFAGQTAFASGVSIADGAWHHVIVALTPFAQTGARVTLYVDGAPRATGLAPREGGAWPAAAGIVTLGNVGGGTLTAQASEFQLWASALDVYQAATTFRRRAAVGTNGLAQVWGLSDAASSGTITGGGNSPFAVSSLTFVTIIAGRPDFAVVAWDLVSGATSYGVEVWSLDGRWEWSAAPSSGAATGVPGLLLGRGYRGRVRSVDATGPGAWSEWVTLVPIDLPALMPQFSWPAIAQPLTASWTTPDQTQGFVLDVGRNPPPTPQPLPQPTSATSVDLSSQFAAGDYGWTVNVWASAAGSFGPPVAAGPTTAPTFSFFYVDDGTGTAGAGSFAFDWTTLPVGLDLLYLSVVKGTTKVIEEVVQAAGAIAPLNFPSPMSVANGDQFTATLRTLGAGAISHPGTQSVIAHDVPQPVLTWTVATTAPEGISEHWASVPGADGYNIALYQDAASTPLVSQTGVAATAFDLTPYLAVVGAATLHSYRLKVQTVSAGEIGPPNTIATLPVASGQMRYDWDGTIGTLKVVWTVSAATGLFYYIRLFSGTATVPDSFLALPFATGSYAQPSPAGGFTEGSIYSFQGYALGQGALAAPDANAVTIHQLNKPLVAFAVDSTQFTLTATWPALTPAAVHYQPVLNGVETGPAQTGLSYDLTAQLAQTTALSFAVEATLDHSFGSASTITPAPAAEPILRYDWLGSGGGTLSLHWNGVPIVYATATQSGQSSPAVKLLDASGLTSLTIPAPQAGFVEGQAWAATVKPIATGSLGTTETTTAIVHQLAQPVATWATLSDPASVQLVWNDIRNSGQQSLTISYQVNLNGTADGAAQTTLTHDFVGLLDRAGTFTATVGGSADGSYSALSAPPAALAAPASVAIMLDLAQQVATASWPQVTAATAYYARLVDASGNVLGRTWVAAGSTPLAQYSAAFQLTAPTNGATYNVQVRALARGGLTDFVSASTAWQDMPAPGLNTPTDDAVAHLVTASWNFDPSASGLTGVTYVAELHQSDGTLIPPPVIVAAKQTTLAYPAGTPAGTVLQVRVRASTATLLGPWSDYVQLAVGSSLQQTTISSFTFNSSNAMRIDWGAVPSPQAGTAVTYAVMVTGAGLKSGVFPFSVNSGTTLQLDAATTGVQPHTTYVATVQPTGPGVAGPVSAAVNATTNTLAPPDPGGGGGDHGGDPIALANGSYSYSCLHLQIEGAFPLEFSSFYSSEMPLTGGSAPYATALPLGRRWSHSFNTRIFIPNPQANPPMVAVIWGSGEVNTYAFTNRIGLLTKSGRPNGDQLSYNPDLSFTLVRKDQSRFDFDANGRLVQMTSPIGNPAMLTYDAASRLSRVTDSGSGRYIDFAYFATGTNAGRINTVTDNAARVVTFAYTGDDLTSAGNPRGGARTFTYDAAGLMKTALYENGDTIIANDWDGQGRVIRQQDGASIGTSRAMTIGWSSGTTTDGFATTIATVTDPAGNVTIYTSLTESQDTIEVTTQLAGGVIYRRRRQYDGISNLLSELVYEGPTGGPDTAGQLTTYAYDGSSNLISVNRGMNTATATIAYDARNNPVQLTDEQGNVTTLSYNPDNTVAETRDVLGGRVVYDFQPGAIKGVPLKVSTYPADGNGGTFNSANITTYTMTPRGQIRTVTDPTGRVTTLAYDDATGWRTGETIGDATGTTVLSSIITPLANGSGQPAQIATCRYGQPAAQASVEVIAYDARGNVQSVTDALSRTTSYRFNGNNFIDLITYPAQAGVSEQLAIGYTDVNLVSTLTISAANPAVAWQFGYDPIGRLLSRTDPNGSATTFVPAMATGGAAGAATTTVQMNLPAAQTGSAATRQSATYDPIGRILALSDIAAVSATPGVTTTAYTTGTGVGSSKTAITTTSWPPADPGSPILMEIVENDAYGRPVRLVDQAGRATMIAYAAQQPQAATNINLIVTLTDISGAQRVIELDPVGRMVSQRWGRPAAGSTPAQWVTAVYTYDALDALTSIVETAPDGTVAATSTYVYAFDAAAGNFTISYCPYGGAAFVYRYDKANQRIAEQAPAGFNASYSYDARGRLASWSGGGGTFNYGYDGAGRFTTATWPDSSVIAHTLDANGNRLTTTRNGAAAVTRSFDALNRLVQRSEASSGQTLSWTWTAMGCPETVTYPGQATPVRYAYDGWQRLKTVADWAGRATAYTYSPTSKLLTTTHANGVTVTNSFDTLDRFTGITSVRAGEIIASSVLTLDAFGRPATLERVLPLAPTPPVARAMTYDGDRLLTLGGTAVGYNAAGAMTTIPGVTGTFGYDAVGQTTAAGSNGYGYDADGLLATVTRGGNAATVTIDPSHYRAPRIEQADPARALQAVMLTKLSAGSAAPLPSPVRAQYPDVLAYPVPETLGPAQPDPFQALPRTGVIQPLIGDLDRILAISAGGTTTRYIHGMGLIGREDPNGYHCYVQDMVGNTLALIGADGTVSDRFAYGPFGDLASHVGSSDDPFRQLGRYGATDFGDGLVGMRFRQFAPAALRFASRDIVFGDRYVSQSWNRYSYVAGNPLQRIDPLGLSDDDSGGGSGGKIAGMVIGAVAGAAVVIIGGGSAAAWYLGPATMGVSGFTGFASIGSRLGLNFGARWGRQLERIRNQMGEEIELEDLDPLLRDPWRD